MRLEHNRQLPWRRGARRGFTLVEVLVVVSIVGLLFALTVAAVQSARGAAHRSACANNLRQIGLAMESYIAGTGVLPPGVSGRGYSFLSQLLPHLDERPLYDSINFEVRATTSISGTLQNRTSARTAVSLFLCPSDPVRLSGSTNYAGCRGGGVSRFGYNGAFAFELDGPSRPAGFTDGMATTISVCEWCVGTPRADDRDARRVVFQTPERLLKPDEFDRFTAMCQSLDSRSAPMNVAVRKGRSWISGDFSYTLYNHVLPSNGHTCTNGTAVQEGAWTAGSDHSGGVNGLFADGHVRFLRSSLQLEIWRAIASRNGAEVVPSDSL